MTLQVKQVPLIVILLGLIFGVMLLKQQPRNGRDSGKDPGLGIPPAPKPRPNEPRRNEPRHSEPMARPVVGNAAGVAYGVEEIISSMNREAREAGVKAYEATMAGFKPRDTRSFAQRAKEDPNFGKWRPPQMPKPATSTAQ